MSRVHQSVARAWNALGTNSEEKAAILNLLSKYPELDETLLKWFWVTKSQEKYFILNQFCSLKQRFTQPISVRSCSNVYTNRGIDCFWLVSLLLNCWLAYYFCGLKKSVYWKIVPFIVKLRACLHGGGGPQVGEVTRLAVVEKWPAFTCKLTTPWPRGDVTRRCCVVDRHVNRENGGRTTHFGGQCSFPLIICSRCNISMLWLFTVTFDDLARLQM